MAQPVDPHLRLFDLLKGNLPNSLKVLWNILLELRGRGVNGSAGIPVNIVSGGSGGDATAANQDEQTALLTTLTTAGSTAAKQDAQTALLTTLSANTPATVQRTVSASVVTGSGASPVAAGAKSVIFGLSTDFVGTIAGAAVDPAQFGSIPYVAPDKDTLGSIAYTVTAGSLLITKIV